MHFFYNNQSHPFFITTFHMIVFIFGCCQTGCQMRNSDIHSHFPLMIPFPCCKCNAILISRLVGWIMLGTRFNFDRSDRFQYLICFRGQHFSHAKQMHLTTTKCVFLYTQVLQFSAVNQEPRNTVCSHFLSRFILF